MVNVNNENKNDDNSKKLKKKKRNPTRGRMPATELNKLERGQNLAGRFVTKMSKSDCVTPAPCDLHWLPSIKI